MFYHREPETYVKFVEISTESGKKLSITRNAYFILILIIKIFFF